MGHTVNPDKEYRLLQQRMDTMVTGAPDSPALVKILSLLFSPEEARFARRMPVRPTPLSQIAQKLEMPLDELNEKVTDMAARGLLLDFYLKDRRYAMLPPVVIGFFEFVFMRAREDLPMADLARLFDQYMSEDGRFARSVFAGQTQVGRSLVREEALPEGDHTEILDWERASRLVETATAVGVSMCACRHKQEHLGKACEAPMEVCMTLNAAAETMARNGIARPVSRNEGLRILEQCKEAGLAQTGDNVQRGVTYICNCCGCCCGMMKAMKTFNLRNAIVTSNWIMEVDETCCKGCGKCVKACPADAISLVDRQQNGRKQKKAVVDPALCLGCGVCYGACKSGGVQMKPRAKRVLTPENTFARVVTMAIERGKLGALLFDDPERFSHRALAGIIGVIEKTPPYKVLMAIEPLRSVFLNRLVQAAR